MSSINVTPGRGAYDVAYNQLQVYTQNNAAALGFTEEELENNATIAESMARSPEDSNGFLILDPTAARAEQIKAVDAFGGDFIYQNGANLKVLDLTDPANLANIDTEQEARVVIKYAVVKGFADEGGFTIDDPRTENVDSVLLSDLPDTVMPFVDLRTLHQFSDGVDTHIASGQNSDYWNGAVGGPKDIEFMPLPAFGASAPADDNNGW